jgi:hypothetical protein
MLLCPFYKHRNIFGKPKQGVHKTRFLGLALVDYVLTIVVAMLTTLVTRVPLVLTTIGWLILGLLLHVLFGVPTDAVKFLGLAC